MAQHSAADVGADDTIAALATAPGRSAIAVLRISGRDALSVAGRVLQPWRPDPPRTSWLSTLKDSRDGTVVDHPLVTVFRAPNSYTGEDIVELSLHGGRLIPTLALSTIIAAGARLALPGEFTRRAVLNGKLDLLQAEAVGDLVDASTRGAHQVALRQLDGGLSRRIGRLRDEILHLEALIAYDIDFPEEDSGIVPRSEVRRSLDDLLGQLTALLETSSAGELVREGAVAVIAGAPNVGKSSLFNAVLGQTRAIVTEIPGTTRDALEALIDIEGWPVRLVDTAGLHEATDVVERLGIETSERYLRAADLVLVCGDSSPTLDAARDRIEALTTAPTIDVLTKADLDTAGSRQLVSDRNEIVRVSAFTGEGLATLTSAMAVRLSESYGSWAAAEAPLLTRERHRRAVELATSELREFDGAWSPNAVPATIAAVHLRAAAHALEELIGAISSEDVLERVFSTFCIGK